jgi:small-conductance mechanosensitive channel
MGFYPFYTRMTVAERAQGTIQMKNVSPPCRGPRRHPSGISRWSLYVLLLCLAFPAGVLGQSPGKDPTAGPDSTQVAPVIIDGKILFKLRGISAYPATKRAAATRARIIDLAEDESFDPDDLVLKEVEDWIVIYAGEQRIVGISEFDAQLENISHNVLAKVFLENIINSINSYRADRSAEKIMHGTLVAVAATLIFIVLLWASQRLFRWLVDWAERDVRKSVRELASKAHYLLHAGRMWSVFAGLLRFLRVATYLVLIYFYLNLVLGLYPWTRPAAKMLFRFVVNPLESLWLGFLGSLPDLIFLVILWLVVSYLLKFIRSFFEAISRGRIPLENFEAEWAMPTYKIIRVLIIAFSLVIAYPYIPGSDSLAFKGVSVFLGVLLSLGSSSLIANLIAGLTMTYRGAFREGDWVRIGETVGTVEVVKLMVTQVRTPKNESIYIPNQNILNTDVVNFSQMAKTEGLILHSTVSIGFDVPWRQVEAMLIQAAERTEGLKSEPPPYVLQTALGDFAASYQVNAFCAEVDRMPQLYSRLHANIQDVFNEHGVQIMSPAYVADPETAKVVPPEQWYAEPASKPE